MNWESELSSNYYMLLFAVVVGLTFNTIIVVIVAKNKKHDKSDIIVKYELAAAIIDDVGKILRPICTHESIFEFVSVVLAVKRAGITF